MLNSIVFFDINCIVWDGGELGEPVKLSAIRTDVKGSEHSNYSTCFKPVSNKKMDYFSKEKLHLNRELLDVSPPASLGLKFFKLWVGTKPCVFLSTLSSFRLLGSLCNQGGTAPPHTSYCLNLETLGFTEQFNRVSAQDSVKRMVKFYRNLPDNSTVLLSRVSRCSDVAEVLGFK